MKGRRPSFSLALALVVSEIPITPRYENWIAL